MPDLSFAVESAEPAPFAAAPQLTLKVRVTTAAADGPIHALLLRCQVRIDAPRRRHPPGDEERLRDLFGPRARWGETMKSLLWAQVSVSTPPFAGSAIVDLPLPCSYDFSQSWAKYFYALEDGEVPLSLLFSGTVFHAAPDGALEVEQIPWDREARFRLPVAVWKATLEAHFPGTAFLPLRQDVFDRLHRYRIARGMPQWEDALESLLPPDLSPAAKSASARLAERAP